MFFELNDGVPRFALGKVVLTEIRQGFDGMEEAVQYERYLFTEAEMAEYQDAVLITQPAAEILTRAQTLIGKSRDFSMMSHQFFRIGFRVIKG